MRGEGRRRGTTPRLPKAKEEKKRSPRGGSVVPKINGGNLERFRSGESAQMQKKYGFLAEKDGPAQADVNCALCTAAAVVMHATGQPMSSADVCAELGFMEEEETVFVRWRKSLSDQSPFGKVNKELRNQIEGVLFFCRRRLNNCACTILGEPGKGAPLKRALARMGKKEKTVRFAVYFHDQFVNHWVYAHKESGSVEFIDYQTDRMFDPHSQPTSGKTPMLGICKSVHPNAELVVLAFDPTRQGGVTVDKA